MISWMSFSGMPQVRSVLAAWLMWLTSALHVPPGVQEEHLRRGRGRLGAVRGCPGRAAAGSARRTGRSSWSRPRRCKTRPAGRPSRHGRPTRSSCDGLAAVVRPCFAGLVARRADLDDLGRGEAGADAQDVIGVQGRRCRSGRAAAPSVGASAVERSSWPPLRMPSAFFTSSGTESVCGMSGTRSTASGGGGEAVASGPGGQSGDRHAGDVNERRATRTSRATTTMPPDLTASASDPAAGAGGADDHSPRLAPAPRAGPAEGDGGTDAPATGSPRRASSDGPAEFFEIEGLDHHPREPARRPPGSSLDPDRVGGHEDQRQVRTGVHAAGRPGSRRRRPEATDRSAPGRACARWPLPAPRRRRTPARRYIRRASGRGRVRRRASSSSSTTRMVSGCSVDGMVRTLASARMGRKLSGAGYARRMPKATTGLSARRRQGFSKRESGKAAGMRRRRREARGQILATGLASVDSPRPASGVCPPSPH